MRLREDELFCRRITQDLSKSAKTKLHLVDLNLKDAPIRLRVPEEELSDTPVNPADPAIEKIRKALTRQAELDAMDALVLPLVLGKHVDHLTVREAALPFTTRLPSAFYEDLPYAATHPSVTVDLDALRTTTEGLHEPLSPIVYRAESAIERKRNLIRIYASQLDEETGDLITGFATRYEGGERLWANQAWLTSADLNRLHTGQP